MKEANYAALALRAIGEQASEKDPPIVAYCGSCGHKTYYVPDVCPSCGSSYIKKISPRRKA